VQNTFSVQELEIEARRNKFNLVCGDVQIIWTTCSLIKLFLSFHGPYIVETIEWTNHRFFSYWWFTFRMTEYLSYCPLLNGLYWIGFHLQLKLLMKSCPCNRPWRPIGLWDVEAPTFSRQSAHRWWWGCQPYALAALYPQEDSCYSYLLEAESTPGPYCGWKY
jgi:hypothetical protein